MNGTRVTLPKRTITFDPICIDDGSLYSAAEAIEKTKEIAKERDKKLYLLSDGVMFHLMELLPKKSDGRLYAIVYPGGRAELKIDITKLP